MKKVLHLTRDYANTIGGVETLLYNLTNSDKKNKHFIAFCDDNVSTIQKTGKCYHLPLPSRGPLDYQKTKKIISEIINEISPDIIQIHTIDFAFFIITTFGSKNYEIIYSHHTPVYLELKPVFKLLNESQCLKKIVVPSEYIKIELKKIIPSEKIIVIYNGIDTSLFKKRDKFECFEKISKMLNSDFLEKRILLCTSRISPEKGVDILIKTLKQLPQEFVLILTGNESAHKTQKVLSSIKWANDPLLDRIIFGPFDYKYIPYFYNISDYALVPSLWEEPFGISVIEGMASEKAVIASKVGGIPEIITHFKSGVLVHPGKPKEIIKNILFLEKNIKIKQKIEKGARKRVLSQFDIQRTVKEYQKIYSL